MTGFNEEALRADEALIKSVEKCVEFEGRDFDVIMNEIVAGERKSHEARATKMAEAAVLSSKDGALGPGVKAFREMIK